MRGVILEHCTWVEAEQLLPQYRVCVLPVGARLKEHGHHLPLNTDWRQAEYLARRVVEVCPVILLPTLQFGYYPAFTEYPGSVTINRETMAQTVNDICTSLHRHGVDRFYVLNTGISTNWALEPARQQLADAGIVMDYTDLHEANRETRDRLRTQSAGTHADELETSVMLAIAPEVVRMERAQPDVHEDRGPGGLTRDPAKGTGVYSPTGAWGDPTAGTREKGEQLVDSLVQHLVTFLDGFARTDYVPAPPRERYLR